MEPLPAPEPGESETTADPWKSFACIQACQAGRVLRWKNSARTFQAGRSDSRRSQPSALARATGARPHASYSAGPTLVLPGSHEVSSHA